MNSRRRFQQVMAYGEIDRVPFFEEGIRPRVINAWRQQGMPSGASLDDLFPFDQRLEIAPDLLPTKWPATRADLDAFRRSLDAGDPQRLPAGWPEEAQTAATNGHTLLLRVHRGLYQTLGVAGWARFAEANLLLKDDPQLVKEMLGIQAAYAVRLLEHILCTVKVDGAIFSEPISGNSGPLISPAMFSQLIEESYDPLLALLRRHGVQTLIVRTYANARSLLPVLLERGFTCLWACEVPREAMDYAAIRRQYGRDLRLIGGIDVDALHQDRETIRGQLRQKLPPLLADGGFIPLADGRVRRIVPYENYVYYRRLLAEIVEG